MAANSALKWDIQMVVELAVLLVMMLADGWDE